MSLEVGQCKNRTNIIIFCACLFTVTHSCIASAAEPQERQLIGLPNQTPSVELDLNKIKTLMSYRRKLAWERAQSVFASVKVKDTNLSNNITPNVPRVLTWTPRSELQRLFSKSIIQLTKEERKTRMPFSMGLLESVWNWNANLVGNIPAWPISRYVSWKQNLSEQENLNGIQGIPRILISPELQTQEFANYAQVESCTKAALNTPQHDVPCFKTGFKNESVAVKLVWKRRLENSFLETYKTDSESLTDIMKSSEQAWEVIKQRSSFPSRNNIFSIKLITGEEYALVGIHIMSKDLPEWFWITLWWSPDSESDFGSDRPSSWSDLGPQWANYKMCAVSDDRNADDDEDINALPESLKKSIRTLTQSFPGETWCSNPYIEEGHKNATTNCMGCHQHAGTAVTSEWAITNTPRLISRQSFPADYLWSISDGSDGFGHDIFNRLKHHDDFDLMRELFPELFNYIF